MPIPITRSSRLLGVSRSHCYYKTHERKRMVDNTESSVLSNLAKHYPSFGYRCLAAMARKNLGRAINRKKCYRILKSLNLTLAPPRRYDHAPQGRHLDQTANMPNLKWQGDITKFRCGIDGWGYLFNIIDCCTREWVGYAFSLRCSTDESLEALHYVISDRFDGQKPARLTLRTDNGPQYTSRRFEIILRILTVAHETTHVNCPDEHALVESFHATLKRDCVHLHEFESFHHARLVIEKYFVDYNMLFPHGSIKMMSPREYYE